MELGINGMVCFVLQTTAATPVVLMGTESTSEMQKVVMGSGGYPLAQQIPTNLVRRRFCCLLGKF